MHVTKMHGMEGQPGVPRRPLGRAVAERVARAAGPAEFAQLKELLRRLMDTADAFSDGDESVDVFDLDQIQSELFHFLVRSRLMSRP
jgi:hypothetical protein